MQIVLPQFDPRRQQSLAEWPKEETHNKGFFQTQGWVKKGTTNHVGGPVFHSLRPSQRENPSESLAGQPCPKSESTRTATVCFISIHLPWRPAQGNISKNTEGMTENSNTIFMQEIQEKYEKLHEECAILCLVISINTFYMSLGTFLNGYSSKLLASFWFPGKLTKKLRYWVDLVSWSKKNQSY